LTRADFARLKTVLLVSQPELGNEGKTRFLLPVDHESLRAGRRLRPACLPNLVFTLGFVTKLMGVRVESHEQITNNIRAFVRATRSVTAAAGDFLGPVRLRMLGFQSYQSSTP
jgi:hypothetical protein